MFSRVLVNAERKHIIWGCGSAGELIVYLTYRKEVLEAMELELHFGY
jgi:hypothetical protein